MAAELARVREATLSALRAETAVTAIGPLPVPMFAASPPPAWLYAAPASRWPTFVRPLPRSTPLPPPVAARPPPAPPPPPPRAPSPPPSPLPVRAPAAGQAAEALKIRMDARAPEPRPPLATLQPLPPLDAPLSTWAALEALEPGGYRRSAGRGAFREPLAARAASPLRLRLRGSELLRRLGLRRPPAPSTAAGLVLWRDTNGWCPYCERVWLALEAMGVEYAERTVNLQSKDGDFLRLAAAHSPTGRSSVPVLSTPDGAHVLWESAEILHYLSGRDAAAAPPLPPLGSPAASAAGAKPPPSPRYHRDGSITQTAKGGATRTVPALHLAPDGARDAWALARASDADILIVDRAIRAVGNATAAFAPPAFGGDPAAALPMTAEREARVATAVAALDALEALLATTANAGPFFGGARVGVADCAAAPFLERWSRSGLIAEQIPALAPLTLREHGVGRWPQLARWYGALAAFRPYAARVEGDQLSYAQLAATFARVGLRAREASGGGSGGARAKGTVRERLLAALPRRAPRPPPPSPPPPLSAEQRARLEARAEAAEAAALKRLPTAAEARALLRVGREPPSASDAAGLRSSAAREVGLARGEALATLVANRERVCADALAGCGLIGGALADWDCADAATCAAEAEVLLRLVGSALATPAPGSPAALLNDAAGALGRELGKPLSEAACARAARLADFVAKRLCVPRDMGAPAGAQLRAALILAAAGLRG